MKDTLKQIEVCSKIRELILKNEEDFQFSFLELRSAAEEKIRQPFEKLVNTALPSGQTLMYLACGEGKLELVQFLHQQGLDPQIKSEVEGRQIECCLTLCARRGYSEIVSYLLDTEKYLESYLKSIIFQYDLPLNCKHILAKRAGLERRKPCACF